MDRPIEYSDPVIAVGIFLPRSSCHLVLPQVDRSPSQAGPWLMNPDKFAGCLLPRPHSDPCCGRGNKHLQAPDQPASKQNITRFSTSKGYAIVNSVLGLSANFKCRLSGGQVKRFLKKKEVAVNLKPVLATIFDNFLSTSDLAGGFSRQP